MLPLQGLMAIFDTMYESLLSLDNVHINFSENSMRIVNIILAFIMFGVALGLKPEIFKKVFQKPKSLLVGLLSQLVALPFLTFVLVVVFNHFITPMVAMGMLLVASCPGGNISNFMTQFSKGNAELSVSLTAVTTTFSPISTPFNFAFWGGLYVKVVNSMAQNVLHPLHIDIFQMLETVFILLGIPLVLGILCTRFLPSLSKKLQKPMQYLSIFFFFVLVAVSFGNNFSIFIQYIPYIFIIVLLHNLLALTTGYSLGVLFRLPSADKRTLTIETGIQNSGLGLALLFNPTIFPPDTAMGGMLLITAWWAVWHIVSGLLIATYWSKKELKNT